MGCGSGLMLIKSVFSTCPQQGGQKFGRRKKQFKYSAGE